MPLPVRDFRKTVTRIYAEKRGQGKKQGRGLSGPKAGNPDGSMARDFSSLALRGMA
jgi:hypothetical protein